MKRPIKRSAVVLSLVVGAALLLSACQISVEPLPPPTPNEEVTAGTNDSAALNTRKNLAAGASWLYKIEVPSSVSSGYDVVYFELSEDLDIQVQNAARQTLFSSSSSEYFGRGNAGLASAAGSSSAEVDAQAITTTVTCRGSCVIFRPGNETTFYLKVTNSGSSSVTYDLFAFGDDFSDPFEPVNNSRSGAPVLNVGLVFNESGALETIGDVDFWYMDNTGQVVFNADSAFLNIRAELQNSSGIPLDTYRSGDTINVTKGDYLRIYSASDRAGASAASLYSLYNP